MRVSIHYVATFVVGLVVGIVAARFFWVPDQGDGNSVYRPPDSGLAYVSAPTHQASDTGENSEDPIATSPAEPQPDTLLPALELEIPEAYLRIIGSTKPHLSFGERVGQYQQEPRDEVWVSAMEAGINSYVAASAPTAGAVFEYIQCRSSACILAGYVIEGKERQSASILGELQSQGWWDGGNSSHGMGGAVGELDAFVILLPRYDLP